MNTSNDEIRVAIAAQAAEWFVANQSGTLDSRTREAFNAWLRSSPIHVAEYLGIAGIARDLPAVARHQDESIAALVAAFRNEDAPQVELPRAAAGHRLRSWLRPLTDSRLVPRAVVAAVLVGGAAVIALWVAGTELPGQPQLYGTKHGEQQAWQLRDGSSLRLNSDSAVTVRFSGQERLVDVTRGQAYFHVARDSARRFRVTVAGASVVAVGTEFDVDRRGESAVVTLIEGQVAVLAAGVSTAIAGATTAGAVLMRQGQQLRLQSGAVVSLTRAANISATTAWLNHQIVSERRSLGEVVEEFNRYASVPIEIADPALRGLQISGVFDAYDTDSFVSFLQSMDGLRVERTARVTRVLGKP
jgi:transmembrane sensor